MKIKIKIQMFVPQTLIQEKYVAKHRQNETIGLLYVKRLKMCLFYFVGKCLLVIERLA